MFGPDSGKGSWGGLNLMYDKVRIGRGSLRQARVDSFLQVICSSTAGTFEIHRHCGPPPPLRSETEHPDMSQESYMAVGVSGKDCKVGKADACPNIM